MPAGSRFGPARNVSGAPLTNGRFSRLEIYLGPGIRIAYGEQGSPYR
jgi:hypothetical protein